MIELDGSLGEGGGQIVRTALALSMITQKPFHITKIRQGREKPGLKMQHLNCITALQKLSESKAEGAMLGSTELTFIPAPLKGRSLAVDIETAGSITLFLQAVLLPCALSGKQMKLELIGGTDVAWSMPIDYFASIVVPHLNRWAEINVKVEKRGYYPAGNGKVVIRVKPNEEKKPIELLEQHNLIHTKGISHASKSLEQARVAERQASAAKQVLAKYSCPINVRTEYSETLSPGSGITLWAVFSKKKDDIDIKEPIILGADALGEKGLPAEQVGKAAAQKLIDAIESKAPVDSHLADNLIPWMALFPPSKIKVQTITPHTLTNINVVEKFLPVKFSTENSVIICNKAC
ncbi:MAG: RNA 3'-terminal phosphate cyclase [Candidatus Woesearchaeota archaeon]